MARRRHRNRAEHPLSRPENERIGPVEARWQPARGQKGDKGEQGERGEQGMSARVRYSLVMLFALGVALALFALVGVIVQTRRFERDQTAQNAHAARVRCEAITEILRIPIPAPVTDNPSREWVYRYVLIQRMRGERLGCHLPPPHFIHVKGS